MVDPIKLTFRPGVNRETTDYENTGGWFDCNLARWKAGSPESIGGWQRFTSGPVLGTMRSLFPWSTLNGQRWYSTGTNLKYYIIRGNEPLDITPIRRSVTLGVNPFATVGLGSTTIRVTDVNHGAVMGDYVTFSGATGPISGIPASEFNIEHVVTSIIDDDTYTITVTTPAAGATTGGGAAVLAEYQINVGLDTSATGNGWGTGPWGGPATPANPGGVGWGEGSDITVSTDQLRLWTEDNFGEDLLFNARDGGIYFKDMSTNAAERAVNLTTLSETGNIPIIARQILVSDNDRHAVAFGTNTIGTVIQDRLLARWSTSENLSQWTPDTTNTAGSLRFDGGSEFLKAVETTTEILVFTDVSLHSMKFIGPPYTFGQVRVGSNIQLIGPNAVVSTGAETAWMANGLFQMYDGVVRDLPCSIRSYVYGILNTAQAEKIVAGVNRTFKEIIWLMPVNGSSENNFYVIMNYEGGWANPIWYYGSFNTAGRTTWLDAWFESTPLASAPDGYIYSHDIGATDGSDGGQIMLDSYLKSSVFELGTGGDFMLVSRTIPDLTFSGSTTAGAQATISFEKRDYPGSPFRVGPNEAVTRTVTMPVEQYTTKIDRRFRARSVQFGIAATALGTLWQLGVPRIYAAPDGQR